MNIGSRKELSLITMAASALLYLSPYKALSKWLGGISLLLYLWPTPQKTLANRTAVITGGSRGLGLALAKALLKENAQVILLARDEQELNQARESLNEFSKQAVRLLTCDITKISQLEQAFKTIKEQHGPIEILINNACTISVGPFQSMETEDFTALLQIQVHAVIQSIQLALPSFLDQGGGNIVNISSIAGKIPVPHMSPYCAAKFALAGLSESITPELLAQNIKVTTVYPGLMRTGSPVQAVFKGDHSKEYAWFASGDVMPGLSVSAEYAANQILKAMKQGQAQVIFPHTSRIATYIHSLFPELFTSLNAQVNRFLPKGQSKIRKTGAQCKNWLDQQIWYRPLKKSALKAELTFNQHYKYDADFNLGVIKATIS